LPLNARQRGHWDAARRKLQALGHRDPESFALAKPARGKTRPDYNSIEHIFFEVLELVRGALAAQHVRVGRTVLELAVFQALREGTTEPVDEIVASVIAQGLHQPGFVIYPLFGFGLLHAPQFSLLNSPPSLDFIDKESGLAVTSRVGSAESLFAFLERAAAGLGVLGKLPTRELRGAVSMTGVMNWLLSNPLLIVRVRSISMGARENQPAYLRAIAHRATLLGLASALAKPRKSSRLLSGSTQSASNQDTLDVRHYFVLESPGDPARPLRFDRVPMGPRRAPLLQLADLYIDLDPAAWTTPSLKRRVGALTDALLDLEDLQAALEGKSKSALAKANVSRKLSTALHWVRRSFASFADPREAVVAMAVAFEALLSDGYSQGVTTTIVARAAACIAAQKGSPALAVAVKTLFEWRGAIVHKGEGPTATDLRGARRAFALCFIDMMGRVTAVTPTKTLEVAALFSPWRAGAVS
jgi:hypothetical protein